MSELYPVQVGSVAKTMLTELCCLIYTIILNTMKLAKLLQLRFTQFAQVSFVQ